MSKNNDIGNSIQKAHARALPGWDRARFEDAKLLEYSLNMFHADGRDKAMAFCQALGYTKDNYLGLKADILRNLGRHEATPRGDSGHGPKFEVVMDLAGPNGKRAHVLSAWILVPETDFPRLTSVYVTRKKVSNSV